MISIIIPVYNEIKCLPILLETVLSVKWPDNLQSEVIVVDDGSVDGSKEWLQANGKKLGLRIFFHAKNKGKGACLRYGFSQAKGTVVVVQDADLEYDPNELPSVVMPIIHGETRVCYGSRILNRDWVQDRSWEKGRGYFSAYLGGRFVTFFCNLLYGSKLTDEPTCYKAFDCNFLRQIVLVSDGFELEVELTAKVLKQTQILEVPIHYYPRTYAEGKKINWLDGVLALIKLIQYKFVD